MTCKAPLIGEFKTRRETLGWSVKEVGERCGIEESCLRDWERGAGSPRLDAAERWASALGLKLSLSTGCRDVSPGVVVDWGHRRITVDGNPVRLTPMEWKALERLAAAPGQLVSHQALFHHLYGTEQPYRAQSTAIRVLITKLRRLLPLRIEAQWGRGYVIGGIEASAPAATLGADVVAERVAATDAVPETRPRESFTVVAGSLSLETPPIPRQVITINRPPMRRAAAVPPPSSTCRAEELGVIERYLAERGATRCPDVATIQHAPLPTLIWDKLKRKWVRPAIPVQQAGQQAGQQVGQQIG